MSRSELISLAGLILASGVITVAWRKLRGVAQMAEDWRGRPERRDPMTGVVIDPGRASMPGRIAALEAQIHPNHGTSLHDQVARLVLIVEQMQRDALASTPEKVGQP